MDSERPYSRGTDPRSGPASGGGGRSASSPHLLASVQGWTCAFPLGDVLEVMRPLRVESLQGLPDWVMGVAIHRGGAVPVLELGRWIGGSEPEAAGRWIVVRAGGRKVVVAVQRVMGIRTLDADGLEPLPSLLRSAPQDAVTALGAADRGLLMVLESARLVSEAIWKTLEAPEEGA